MKNLGPVTNAKDIPTKEYVDSQFLFGDFDNAPVLQTIDYVVPAETEVYEIFRTDSRYPEAAQVAFRITFSYFNEWWHTRSELNVIASWSTKYFQGGPYYPIVLVSGGQNIADVYAKSILLIKPTQSNERCRFAFMKSGGEDGLRIRVTIKVIKTVSNIVWNSSCTTPSYNAQNSKQEKIFQSSLDNNQVRIIGDIGVSSLRVYNNPMIELGRDVPGDRWNIKLRYNAGSYTGAAVIKAYVSVRRYGGNYWRHPVDCDADDYDEETGEEIEYDGCRMGFELARQSYNPRLQIPQWMSESQASKQHVTLRTEFWVAASSYDDMTFSGTLDQDGNHVATLNLRKWLIPLLKPLQGSWSEAGIIGVGDAKAPLLFKFKLFTAEGELLAETKNTLAVGISRSRGGPDLSDGLESGLIPGKEWLYASIR